MTLAEKRVVYDFMDLPAAADVSYVDGSDAMLSDDDRVTEADRESRFAGKLAVKVQRRPKPATPPQN